MSSYFEMRQERPGTGIHRQVSISSIRPNPSQQFSISNIRMFRPCRIRRTSFEGKPRLITTGIHPRADRRYTEIGKKIIDSLGVFERLVPSHFREGESYIGCLLCITLDWHSAALLNSTMHKCHSVRLDTDHIFANSWS